ncbi:hypothetical protein QQP08_002340 [Theobroma cacao]|nr:hypothetical protein QQP08_002340 [Theobroma cacao]
MAVKEVEVLFLLPQLTNNCTLKIRLWMQKFVSRKARFRGLPTRIILISQSFTNVAFIQATAAHGYDVSFPVWTIAIAITIGS